MLKIAADHSGSESRCLFHPLHTPCQSCHRNRRNQSPTRQQVVQPAVAPQGADILPRFGSHCVALPADVRTASEQRAHRLVKATVCLPHYLQQTFGVHSLSRCPFPVTRCPVPFPLQLAAAIKQLPKQPSCCLRQTAGHKSSNPLHFWLSDSIFTAR